MLCFLASAQLIIVDRNLDPVSLHFAFGPPRTKLPFIQSLRYFYTKSRSIPLSNSPLSKYNDELVAEMVYNFSISKYKYLADPLELRKFLSLSIFEYKRIVLYLLDGLQVLVSNKPQFKLSCQYVKKFVDRAIKNSIDLKIYLHELEFFESSFHSLLFLSERIFFYRVLLSQFHGLSLLPQRALPKSTQLAIPDNFLTLSGDFLLIERDLRSRSSDSEELLQGIPIVNDAKLIASSPGIAFQDALQILGLANRNFDIHRTILSMSDLLPQIKSTETREFLRNRINSRRTQLLSEHLLNESKKFSFIISRRRRAALKHLATVLKLCDSLPLIKEAFDRVLNLRNTFNFSEELEFCLSDIQMYILSDHSNRHRLPPRKFKTGISRDHLGLSSLVSLASQYGLVILFALFINTLGILFFIRYK
jgi:hypothetical protein